MRCPKTKDRICVECKANFPSGQPLSRVGMALACITPYPSQMANLQASGVKTFGAEVELGSESQYAASHITSPTDQHRDDKAEEDVSELLSQKMLQGWALLETCCPRSVPQESTGTSFSFRDIATYKA